MKGSCVCMHEVLQWHPLALHAAIENTAQSVDSTTSLQTQEERYENLVIQPFTSLMGFFVVKYSPLLLLCVCVGHLHSTWSPLGLIFPCKLWQSLAICYQKLLEKSWPCFVFLESQFARGNSAVAAEGHWSRFGRVGMNRWKNRQDADRKFSFIFSQYPGGVLRTGRVVRGFLSF